MRAREDVDRASDDTVWLRGDESEGLRARATWVKDDRRGWVDGMLLHTGWTIVMR